MKITRLQRFILKELFRARGKLDSYTFYKRYYVTPSQLVSSIARFTREEYIKESDGVLILTPKGKRWLVEQGVVADGTEKCVWKIIPENFVQPKIPSWSPYVPEIKLLHRSLKPE